MYYRHIFGVLCCALLICIVGLNLRAEGTRGCDTRRVAEYVGGNCPETIDAGNRRRFILVTLFSRGPTFPSTGSHT